LSVCVRSIKFLHARRHGGDGLPTTESRGTLMNTPASNTLNLLGRLGLAALFLPAGIGKITGFSGTVGYIASVGLPMATLGAILAVVVEVAGGLALLLGYKTRI